MKKFFTIAWILIPLAACAPTTKMPKVDSKLAAAEAEKQRELVVKQFVADQRQLHQVAYPILRGNVELCGEKLNRRTGLMISNLYQFPESFRAAAFKVTGLDEELTVIAVAKSSPAATAGFRRGDILVALNGEKIAGGDDGLKKFGQLYQSALEDDVTVRFDVRRNVCVGADRPCNLANSNLLCRPLDTLLGAS